MDEFKSQFKVEKFDEEQRIVYGWAMISRTTDGKEVVDAHGDTVDPGELEKAAGEFMLESRKSGVMHKGVAIADVHTSVVMTKEIQKAMNIPDGNVPVAWFLGIKIHDQGTFEKVKKGELQMFSIQGTTQRTGNA